MDFINLSASNEAAQENKSDSYFGWMEFFFIWQVWAKCFYIGYFTRWRSDQCWHSHRLCRSASPTRCVRSLVLIIMYIHVLLYVYILKLKHNILHYIIHVCIINPCNFNSINLKESIKSEKWCTKPSLYDVVRIKMLKIKFFLIFPIIFYLYNLSSSTCTI